MQRHDDNPIPLQRLASNQVAVIKSANGTIISARISLRYLYEILAERRLITEHQVSCGHRYVAMKNGFNSKAGYAKMTEMLGDIFPTEGEHSGDMERLYRMVFLAIGKAAEQAILHAMDTPSSGFFHCGTIMAGAFEKLESCFEQAKKKLDAEQEVR